MELLRNFRRRRLAAELLHHGMRRAQHAVDRLDHMYRDADGSGLVGNRARNGLPDPPGSIRRKFIALRVVEFFDCLHKPEVSLLNEVQKLHPAPHIALGDRHNKAEVRLRHALSRRVLLLLAALDHLFRDLKLFLRRKQLDFADLLEIHPDGVVELDVGVVNILDIFIGNVEALVLDGLHFAERRVIELGGPDEVEHVRNVNLHPRRFQNVVEFFGLLLRRIHSVERLDQLFGRNLTRLFGLFEQRLQFRAVFFGQIHFAQQFQFLCHRLTSVFHSFFPLRQLK